VYFLQQKALYHWYIFKVLPAVVAQELKGTKDFHPCAFAEMQQYWI
jgi:hypothetical protein